jgi:Holliday junction resolvase RusA-like endonuclease
MKKKIESYLIARANPFFDDIIIFLDDLPSSNDKLKPIDFENRIFQLIEKNNVTEFRKNLQERLRKNKKVTWPYKCDLFMLVGIAGSKQDVYDKDLDNLLKTLFDTLKGIVFEDDKQIIRLVAEKDMTDRYKGVIVALKQIQPGQDVRCDLHAFSTGKDDPWKIERDNKINKGRHTNMDFY